MNYYLYLAICWLTHPFRYIMWGYGRKNVSTLGTNSLEFFTQFFNLTLGQRKVANFRFASKLLFWNDTARSYVENQSRKETGWDSEKFKQHNVLFNMTVSRSKKYQSGSTWLGSNEDNGGKYAFATYSSVYKSLYDYYDWMRNPERIGKQYSDYFKFLFFGDGRVKGTYNPALTNAEATNFYLLATGTFSAAGFFTSNAQDYYLTVSSFRDAFQTNNWRFVLNIIYAVVIPAFVIYWFTYRTPANKKSSQNKNGTSQTTVTEKVLYDERRPWKSRFWKQRLFRANGTKEIVKVSKF